jgi:TPP-dependent pyruvate/acetoin dehydrogenase alpha subunit
LSSQLKIDLASGMIQSSKIIDENLDISTISPKELIEQLNAMIRIRQSEIKIAEMRKEGHIGGPVHLGAGQEAVAVGISSHLRKSDRIFSAHRSHAHLLALGSDVRKLFAELLGKSTGLTRGMGGSMHLWDQPNGFYGSVPIVAGTVPLAVGAGLAAKMQKTGDIAVAYFGDGAAEEGVVQESLNLASQLGVPILFVCENNFFSSHMHISQRQPIQSVARFAEANNIVNEVVDGNNVIAVGEAASKLIGDSRKSNVPAFLEVVTFRHYGHVDWREDIDVGVNRSASEVEKWKSRDPIERLKSALLKNDLLNQDELKNIYQNIDSEIESAWSAAISDPFPVTEDLLRTVYKEVRK